MIVSHCVCCKNEKLKSTPAVLMPFVAQRAFGWEPVEIDESWGLRDIKKGHAYSICKTLHCEVCHHLFLDIRFSEDEMAALYQGYREKAYSELREKYEPGYKSKNEELAAGSDYLAASEDFLKPLLKTSPQVLDWGGDTGVNTPYKTSAKTLHIYDINEKTKPLYGQKVNRDSIAKNVYDLIVLTNVLEHIPYPDQLIKEIQKVMRPETVLFIEVPYEELMKTNAENDDLYLKKKHWHEHINFFSERSIKILLEKAGLKIISFRILEIKKNVFAFQLSCKI